MNTRQDENQAGSALPHKSDGPMGENENLSPKNQNRHSPLDKARRGRPGISRDEWPEILSRAEHFRYVLAERSGPAELSLWDEIAEPLRKVNTKEEVNKLFEAKRYGDYFTPALSDLILRTVREEKFPKQDREAQIKFLAHSIAALGRVGPKRSRDICEAQRRKQANEQLYKRADWLLHSAGFR